MSVDVMSKPSLVLETHNFFWRSDTFIERNGIEIRENKHYNYTYLAALHHLLLHHGDLVLVGFWIWF